MNKLERGTIRSLWSLAQYDVVHDGGQHRLLCAYHVAQHWMQYEVEPHMIQYDGPCSEGCPIRKRIDEERRSEEATSELARAAYRHKNEAENIADIAAAKESGAIEYAADSLLVLHEVDGQIRVTIPKNRGRGVEPFAMTLDKDTMTFTQVDAIEEKSR